MRRNFLLIALGCLAKVLLAQSASCYVRLAGVDVQFAVDSTQVLITWPKGIAQDKKAGFLSVCPLLDVYDEAFEVGFPEVVLAQLRPEWQYPGAYKRVQQYFKGTALVNPILWYQGGTQQAVYGTIFLGLRSKADTILLDQLVHEHQLENARPHLGLIYACDISLRSQIDALDLSNQLTREGRFDFVEPDFVYWCKHSTNDTYFADQWALKNTGQDGGTVGADIEIEPAWAISTGSSSIKVAIIDCFGSAAQFSHPDLTFYATHDATGSGFASSGFNDAHGICCAGIVAATSNNSTGVTGVSPGCRVIAVKVGNKTSSTNWTAVGASISNGITWAYQNADVISNSNTFGSPSTVINTSIQNSTTLGRSGKGTPFLSSSGNDNDQVVNYPASLQWAIAVGATSMCEERKSPTSCDGETGWGSDYGVGLDVTAPGVRIYTTDINGSSGFSSGGYYSSFNGTSSACPMAAGVMALVLSVDPTLTYAEARAVLESTCDKIGGYDFTSGTSNPNGSWASEVGYGRVNAYAAVAMAAGMVPNDACNGAIQLTSHLSCIPTSGWVDNANPDGFPGIPYCDNSLTNAQCGVTPSMYGVFYKFTAVSTTHTIEVNPTPTGAGSLDAVITLYSGTICTNLTLVDCEDTPGGQGGTSTLTYSNCIPGQTYWIRVYDWCLQSSITDGRFEVCVTHIPPPNYDNVFVANEQLTPESVHAGEDLLITCTLSYQGTTPDASMPSPDVNYYLDTDCSISGADFIADDNGSIGSDDPASDEDHAFTIPIDLQPGTYYILFEADADGEIAEGSYEADNLSCLEFTVLPPQNASVAASAFLEGPYNSTSQLMSDNLRAMAFVPLSDPWGLGQSTTSNVLATTGGNAIVDWVRMELRSPSNPAVVVASRAALLQRDGDIVDMDGASNVSFGQPTGLYYLCVRPRNHLPVMSANAVDVNAPVDFRSATTTTYGVEARKAIGTQMVLWAGDVNTDGLLRYTGSGNDRDLILARIGGVVPNNTVPGYYGEDVNMDGVVKYTGTGNDKDPILVNVGGTTPNNTRTEQLP